MNMLHKPPTAYKLVAHPFTVVQKSHIAPRKVERTTSFPKRAAWCRKRASTKTSSYDTEILTATISEQQVPSPDHCGQFDWLDNWFPVCFVSDLDSAVPQRFTLLGTDIVCWFNMNANSWQAFRDICPHRLVPLSEGRITSDGLLECGYHGWAFHTNGTCRVIPQGGDCNSPRACATVYPVVVRQGLLFVKLVPLTGGGAGQQPIPQEEMARVPIVHELEDHDFVSVDTWRDLPMDWSTLMENVLDPSHVPFTHHKSISNRYDIGAYDMSLRRKTDKDGFEGIWQTGPRAGKLGPQSTEYRPPVYMQSKLVSEERGYESLVVVYAVPSRPGRCRVINRNCFKFTKSKLPANIMRFISKVIPWFSHVSSNIPLEDDQIFLHLGELELLKQHAAGRTTAQACYMPSKADTFVIAFRNWLERFGQGGPFGPITPQQLGERLDRDQLLDRYTQHTRSCLQCMRALKNIQLASAFTRGVRNVACVVAVLTAAMALAGPVGTTGAAAVEATGLQGQIGAALLQAAAWVTGAVAGPEAQALRSVAWGVAALLASMAVRALSSLEAKFYKGSYPPPRNQSPGPSLAQQKAA